MANTDQKPALVPYDMTEPLRDYLYRANELGVAEGPMGGQELTPEILELVRAAHVVLSGGRVEVKIVDEGNATVRDELDERVLAAQAASNELARDRGAYVTTLP